MGVGLSSWFSLRVVIKFAYCCSKLILCLAWSFDGYSAEEVDDERMYPVASNNVFFRLGVPICRVPLARLVGNFNGNELLF